MIMLEYLYRGPMQDLREEEEKKEKKKKEMIKKRINLFMFDFFFSIK
jgi:hypothetical protein